LNVCLNAQHKQYCVSNSIQNLKQHNIFTGGCGTIAEWMKIDPKMQLTQFQPSETIHRYNYKGHDGEEVPKNVTHVTIDESVEIIKTNAFHNCRYLYSVIMYDNVKRIKDFAFSHCGCLKFIRLSKTLQHIECYAFSHCLGLEVIFLPNTIQKLGWSVFEYCLRLKMFHLPHNINEEELNEVQAIIEDTKIEKIAKKDGRMYEENKSRFGEDFTEESNEKVNAWLIHHMCTFPLHKICYNASVTTKDISFYLNENGNDSVQQNDRHYGMIPLHILSMNPYATTEAVIFLMNVNLKTAFYEDNDNMTPLDYARKFNFKALVQMIKTLLREI